MSEIHKLNHRLLNVGRNVTEYRMTVTEARALAEEIALLEEECDSLEMKLQEKDYQEIVSKATKETRILDGGSF
jgi:uncharacterized protein Yka (UPF0111/DUF47 family)